jgi:hypothetical protein
VKSHPRIKPRIPVIKTPTRKRFDPGAGYDIDLDIIDAIFHRSPGLRAKAKKLYLDPRIGGLQGKPDKRGHWTEADKVVPAHQQEGEKIRRMVRKRLQYVLDNASEGLEVPMSVAAGALGVNESAVRALWKKAHSSSRLAASAGRRVGRKGRAKMQVEDLRKLAEVAYAEAQAKILSKILPKSPSVPFKRPLATASNVPPVSSALHATGTSITFNLNADAAAEQLEAFFKHLIPFLLTAARDKIVDSLSASGLTDAQLLKRLSEGAELQYMSIQQAMTMAWEDVEQQTRWAELYQAMLAARIEQAWTEQARVASDLLEGHLPQTKRRAMVRRIKPEPPPRKRL